MPIYPGSTTNINLYPTTPTELNIALYPAPEAGGIALVQSASGTTADGSAGLTVNFGVPVTVGNTALAFISYVGVGGVTLTTFSDPAAEVANDTAFTGLIYQWFATATPTGFTLTANDAVRAVRASMTILEFSGLANAAAFAANTASGTVNNLGKPPITAVTGDLDNTGHATSLLVGIIATDASNMADMGGSLTPIGNVVGGATVYQTVGYLVTSAASASNFGTSGNADGVAFAGAIAGFDPA